MQYEKSQTKQTSKLRLFTKWIIFHNNLHTKQKTLFWRNHNDAMHPNIAGKIADKWWQKLEEKFNITLHGYLKEVKLDTLYHHLKKEYDTDHFTTTSYAKMNH